MKLPCLSLLYLAHRCKIKKTPTSSQVRLVTGIWFGTTNSIALFWTLLSGILPTAIIETSVLAVGITNSNATAAILKTLILLMENWFSQPGAPLD